MSYASTHLVKHKHNDNGNDKGEEGKLWHLHPFEIRNMKWEEKLTVR